MRGWRFLSDTSREAEIANTAGAPVPLHVDAVSKRFDRTVALDSLSFEVRAGEIFGLLGPNGAGKTTLIRTILDFLRPDAGRIELFGRAFQRDDRNRIGYLPEERGLYPRQHVGTLLEYLATLKGLTRRDAARRVAAWLARLEIADAAPQQVEDRQRRTIEILMSSFDADELLRGKIIGLAAAGLLQVAIYVGLLIVPGMTVLAIFQVPKS